MTKYTVKKEKRTSKTKLTKGAFGGTDRDIGEYATLRILPRSKRTKDNCDEYGVQKSNI